MDFLRDRFRGPFFHHHHHDGKRISLLCLIEEYIAESTSKNFFSYSTELVFSQTFENFYIWIANLSSFLFFQRRIFGAILGWTTDGQLGSAPHFLQMQINTKM